MDTFETKVVDRYGGWLWRGFARNFPPLLLALALGICAVMLFYPREHVMVYNEVIEPNPAHPGELANLVYTANNTETCDGVVYKWVVDLRGTKHVLAVDVAAYHSVESKVEVYHKPFYVPLGAAPGPAFYKSHVVRYCNAVQEFIWPTTDDYTVPFVIESGAVLSPPGRGGANNPK